MKKKHETQVELDLLLTFLRYDPGTGQLVWLPRTGCSKKIRAWNTRFAGQFAGTITKYGYVRVRMPGKEHKHMAHRIICAFLTGSWPPQEIDHRDGNRSNNQIDNLRQATRSENSRNQGIRIDNTSGMKGVSFYSSTCKWLATITYNGKQHNLGYYNTPEEAAVAYKRASLSHHGDFSRISELID